MAAQGRLWNRSDLVWFAIAGVEMAGSVVISSWGSASGCVEEGFLQVVSVVCRLSSFSEEGEVRGLVQSWVADRDDGKGINSAFEPAIVSSALLFAALHVPLMWSPIGVKGGLTIVLSTFGVGSAVRS